MMENEQRREALGKEIEKKITAGKRIDKDHEKEEKYIRFISLR
jgi:hypothetical protein